MVQPSVVEWARFRSEDPHAVLGLPNEPRPAHPEAVKKAYARLAKVWHPDKGGHTVAMQLINAALDRLRVDPPPPATPPPRGQPAASSGERPPPDPQPAPPPPPPPATPPPRGQPAASSGERPPPDPQPGWSSTPAGDTSAPVPPPPGTQAQRCGGRHKVAKKGSGGLPKYDMFNAASDGCLDCVRYYVEVGGVDAASRSDTHGYTGVAWAEYARGREMGEGHKAVAAYLRAAACP